MLGLIFFRGTGHILSMKLITSGLKGKQRPPLESLFINNGIVGTVAPEPPVPSVEAEEGESISIDCNSLPGAGVNLYKLNATSRI